MDVKEKTELLDTLEIELLRDGYSNLSLNLEEFEDLHPDRRWKEFSVCMNEADLPAKYSIFLDGELRWEEAAELLS